jgi:cell division protein FtsB
LATLVRCLNKAKEKNQVMLSRRVSSILIIGGGFLFLISFLLIAGCTGEIKAENEKLKKENAELIAENAKLKSDASRLLGDNSQLHTQIAELNMQISKLQTESVAFHNEIDELKTQLKGQKKKR